LPWESRKTNKRKNSKRLKKKDITFISLNYAPEDSAIGLYSSQWVEFLESNGHNVTVVTAFPYYPQWEVYKDYKTKPLFYKESIGQTTILRYKQYVPKAPTFFKRIVHLIDFTIGSFINLFKIKNCDLVIAVVPFTSSAFLGWIQKKRFNAKLWVHIQDFEFDAALQTGVSKKTNALFSILFKIESWILNRASVTSTISHSMLDKLSQKTKSSTFYLPNWIDQNTIDPLTAIPHNYTKLKKITLLYSGNIGDKQDWDSFIEFCNDLDKSRYDVIIVGDGAKKDWVLENTLNLSNVTYYPPVPYNELSDLLCSTDIHLLFQKPDLLDTVMPSKVLGMMASAKPSIIIGHKDSEINSTFKTTDAGLFFDHYSKEVIKQLDQLTSEDTRMKNMGSNSRAYVLNHFSKEMILNRMLKKVNNL
jgi:colanic acid biosynthesis glycosyl transferase WcaI